MSQATLPRRNIEQIKRGNEEIREVETPEEDTQRPATPGSELKSSSNAGKNGQQDSCQSTKTKAEKIQEGLERTISYEAKGKIDDILDGVNQLSDVEKLLLYLKLPTGSALGYHKDGSSSSNMASANRMEQIRSVTWIKSHLEEDPETSLPKQEVFDDYKMYCESHGYKFLSQADFGKVMKCVFPNVKPRRLGQRGQSKHCYGGLRKKVTMKPPTLPEISILRNEEQQQSCSSGGLDEAELLSSSCQLVCEWAQKLLNQSFAGVRDLAEHLVSSNYVNSRSMAAFTLLAAGRKTAPQATATTATPAVAPGVKKPQQAPHTPVAGGVGGGSGAGHSNHRHRETQLQLQRKLQEREMLREQKRKLEQQRSEIEADNDSRDSNDTNSRDSVAMVTMAGGGGSQGKSMAAVASEGGGRPRVGSVGGRGEVGGKASAVTPQKLILPKTLSKISPASAPSTPQGATGNKMTTAATMSPAGGAGGTAQQILVFSPTAHSSQLNQQPLLILSPLNQKGGSPQIQQTTGAIQTTQQVNIIPPTKEHGVAQLQTVAVSLQQHQSVNNGSEGIQTSSAKPVNYQAGVMLNTSTALAAATIPGQSPVSAQTVFQLVPNNPATNITVPSIPTNNVPTPPSKTLTSHITKTLTSHITTTATSQGQVAVQVQHSTPTDSKSQLSSEFTTQVPTTQTTQSLSSRGVRSYSGPILTKENAHSLLSEPFNSRRSLLFDKKSATSSPSSTSSSSSSSSSSSDGESSMTKKKPSSVAQPQQDSVSVVKQVNGTQVLKINDPSQIPMLPGAEGNGGIKSPPCVDKNGGKGTNRLLSKTVSSLLKEQRGYNPTVEPKPTYVNDRRPVAELLRESRERQQFRQQLVGNLGTSTISPKTVMIQTVTVSKPGVESVETSTAQGSPLAPVTASNTIYLKRNSSGAVTSATTQKLTLQQQGSPVHVISIPKSSVTDDIISPNVSLAPKRSLSSESGPRKRFCSGDGHHDILQTPHGTLEVLKTEQSPDGNLKMKLLSHPVPTSKGQGHSRVRGKNTRAPPTATVTNTNGVRPKLDGGRKREISICSDKESFDYVGNEPDVDLADINPSITFMGSNQEEKVKRTDQGAQGAPQAASASGGSAQQQAISMTSKEFADGVNLAQQQQQQTVAEGVTLVQQQQQQQQQPTVMSQQQQQQVLQRILSLASQSGADSRKNMLRTAIAQGHTQGQAVQALAAVLATQQKAKQQQQQQQLQLQQQQQQSSLGFLSQQDSGLNLQETSDQITTADVNQQQQQQQTKSGLNAAQLNELLMGVSDQLMPQLKQDVLLSQAAADTFQGRLMRSRSLSGPAQRRPSVTSVASAEDMARQRSMSTIGFAPNAPHLNVNLINALKQPVSACVPQSPLSSAASMQQHSPVVRTGSMSLPGSRRSSFVGSLSSSPVGMMSPGGGGPSSAQASAASTPISVMSPGMNPAYRSTGASPVEPSNSFMPIQNSFQDSTASVNLVRPMVTMASAMAQTNISNPQVAQTPLLQGSGSGFVPYPLGKEQDLQQQLDLSSDGATNLLSPQAINQFNNTNLSSLFTAQEQQQLRQQLQQHQLQQQQQQQTMHLQNRNPPPAYNIATLQQQLQNNQPVVNATTLHQRLAAQQKMLANSKEDGKFAPVSSIKPVKRGGKGSKPATSAKRQRHRSAQPAIGRNTGPPSPAVPTAQARVPATKNALLHALLSGTTPAQPPSLQTAHHSTGHKVTFNLPATTNTYHAIGNHSNHGNHGGGVGNHGGGVGNHGGGVGNHGGGVLGGGGDNPLASPLGPATPESPFSPEIQNILDDGGGGGMSAGMSGAGVGMNGAGGMSAVFRSHSVPVQDMLGGTGVNGDDAYDFITGNMLLDQSQQQQHQQQQDPSSAGLSSDAAALKSDLTSILSSKLQTDSSLDASRGLHFMASDDFSAKRNLTLMLEAKPMATDGVGGGVSIFDNFNSAQNQQEMALFDSYTTPKGDVTLASTASLYDDGNKYIQGAGGGGGQCTPGDPTPPGSQNQTPDLTHEFNLMQQQQLQQQQHVVTLQQHVQQQQQHHVTNIFNSTATSGGSVIANMLHGAGSSLVDTPSSLDTMSAHDSRESLGDPFLHGYTDTVTDITSDLSGGQPMDMEPLDFTFSNVDSVMPQMVSEAIQ